MENDCEKFMRLFIQALQDLPPNEVKLEIEKAICLLQSEQKLTKGLVGKSSVESSIVLERCNEEVDPLIQ